MFKNISMTRCSLKLASVAALLALSLQANATDLYSNSFNSDSDISKLNLTKGSAQVKIESYNHGGRSGTAARLWQWESSDWESIIGAPDFSDTNAATLKFSYYAPSTTWQYRLQGKFPGLSSKSPHFGGNKNDNPVWNRWSVRLMWISTSDNVNKGEDGKARPSIYIYDQNRKKGSFGKHHIASDVFLPKSKWVDVALYVKVNTHQKGTGRAWSNGEARLYLDGKLIKTVSNLKLIGDLPSQYGNQAPNSAKVAKMAFHNYYGGNKKTCTNVPFDPADEEDGLTSENHCTDDNKDKNTGFKTWLFMENLKVVNGLSTS